MNSSAPPPGDSSAPVTTVEELRYRSPREEYRRARTRSQTVVFGAAMLGLVILFLLGFLGVSGALPLPFGADFSKKENYAETGDIPCPTPGARAGYPEGVDLTILNTTPTPGLAGKVAGTFEELGYTITATDNAPQYHGLARIEAGPRGVDDAYTLARYFPGEVRIVLSSTETRGLTVVLGNKFEKLVSKKEREELLDRHSPLMPASRCLPVLEPAGGWGAQSDQSGQSGQLEDDEE